MFDMIGNLQDAIDNLRERPDHFYQRTSVEGILDVMSVRGGSYRAQIMVGRTKQVVACKITSEAMIQKAIKLFGKRVAAHGRVKYTKSGEPVEIEVGSIRQLGGSPLPTFEDLEGIDITNGIDPTEYIRRLRDTTRNCEASATNTGLVCENSWGV